MIDGEPPKQATPFNFNEQEIQEVRQNLAGEKKISDDLIKKVTNDPLVAECSVAIFFPVIGDRIKNGERPIVQQIQTGARSKAMKVTFGENDSYIIKSIENSREPIIAKIVADIGVGPEQFESLNGYITEKFIEGTSINNLDEDRCTPQFMEEIGFKIGEAVKKVHQQGIVINDQLLSDDFSKSHTIISPNGEVHFIDFGASIGLSNFPNISDNAVYLIINSDPFAAGQLRTIQDRDARLKFIGEYRRKVLKEFKTKEEIIDRYDGQLIGEGFWFLSQYVPNVDSLKIGFQKGNA